MYMDNQLYMYVKRAVIYNNYYLIVTNLFSVANSH